MLPIPVPSNFRIIAHRGASAYAPENTDSAFKLATEMGIKEFETDTQLSTDGTVVLCHDTNLERYGHGSKVIEGSSSYELLALDMGSWFSPFLFSKERMLTLDELFSIYRENVTYHIELKGEAKELPQQVLHVIRKFNVRDSCIVTSFSFDALRSMRSLTDELRLGWLVEQINTQVCEKAIELGLFQLCLRVDQATSEMVKLGRTVVQEIRAWGVSEQPQEVVKHIQQVVKSGCDGMTINWPDWVVHQSR